MSKVLYLLTTLFDSGLSVFGIRAGYEQPAYRVVQTIPPGIEIRAYPPRQAVETPIAAGGQSEAFGRLFRYITGANASRQSVAMTAPVERTSQLIAMTVPVEIAGDSAVMRFFLPESVARAGAPVPTDRLVHLVGLPSVTLGVIRYAGAANEETRAAKLAQLRAALRAAGRSAAGPPSYFSYDPPFTMPFLRRNEVALPIGP